MREIRTYGLTRGRALRDIRGVPLYITSNKTRAEKHDQATGNLENLYSACNLFLHGV